MTFISYLRLTFIHPFKKLNEKVVIKIKAFFKWLFTIYSRLAFPHTYRTKSSKQLNLLTWLCSICWMLEWNWSWNVAFQRWSNRLSHCVKIFRDATLHWSVSTLLLSTTANSLFEIDKYLRCNESFLERPRQACEYV